MTPLLGEERQARVWSIISLAESLSPRFKTRPGPNNKGGSPCNPELPAARPALGVSKNGPSTAKHRQRRDLGVLLLDAELSALL